MSSVHRHPGDDHFAGLEHAAREATRNPIPGGHTMTAPDTRPEAVEALERATTAVFEAMCQLAQDYDIPRETVWNDCDAMDAARETARVVLSAALEAERGRREAAEALAEAVRAYSDSDSYAETTEAVEAMEAALAAWDAALAPDGRDGEERDDG